MHHCLNCSIVASAFSSRELEWCLNGPVFIQLTLTLDDFLEHLGSIVGRGCIGKGIPFSRDYAGWERRKPINRPKAQPRLKYADLKIRPLIQLKTVTELR